MEKYLLFPGHCETRMSELVRILLTTPFTIFNTELSDNLTVLWGFPGVSDVLSQLRSLKEQLEMSRAEAAGQGRAVQQLLQVTLPQVAAKDSLQNMSLDGLQEELDKIEMGLKDDLEPSMTDLKAQNVLVSLDQKAAGSMVNDLKDTAIQQDGRVAELDVKVKSLLKPSSRTGVNNALLQMDTRVARVSTQLTAVDTADKQSVCESGRVTLDGDDRKVEFQFQRPFPMTPQLAFSVCGFNLQLQYIDDTQDDYDSTSGGSIEDALGTRINAACTKSGATIEMFDLSVGGPQSSTIDVCFQACTHM
ncbi:hypothetical protein ACOMHN_057047 [Nucella lapillus]